jgi:FtsZ-binding cell division protein ZapB
MPTSSNAQNTRPLMQALEEKIKLLISQNLVMSLEIAQLKQQNDHLMTQLREQDDATETINHP